MNLHPTTQLSRRHFLRVPSVLVLLGAVTSLCACNAGPRRIGTAPGLAAGDDMPTMRNVADPNAPFTLRPTGPRLVDRQPLLDVNNVPICSEDQLSLFETRSRISGDNHTLQLTLENRGTGCRLSGFPSITLLDPRGDVVGGVQIVKVSPTKLAATLARPGHTADATTLSTPAADVLLAASGSAAFELGWTSGPGCREVSRIAVSAPGSTQSAYVPRQLAVCENRILLTAVASGGAD